MPIIKACSVRPVPAHSLASLGTLMRQAGPSPLAAVNSIVWQLLLVLPLLLLVLVLLLLQFVVSCS